MGLPGPGGSPCPGGVGLPGPGGVLPVLEGMGLPGPGGGVLPVLGGFSLPGDPPPWTESQTRVKI